MQLPELPGLLALYQEVDDGLRLLRRHVGDILELGRALAFQVERRRSDRVGPGLVVGDAAARAVVLEDDRPRNLLLARRVETELVREVAEAVGVADDWHAVLVALPVLNDGGTLPFVGRALPQGQLGMLLVEGQIDALRPQNVLRSGLEK